MFKSFLKISQRMIEKVSFLNKSQRQSMFVIKGQDRLKTKILAKLKKITVTLPIYDKKAQKFFITKDKQNLFHSGLISSLIIRDKKVFIGLSLPEKVPDLYGPVSEEIEKNLKYDFPDYEFYINLTFETVGNKKSFDKDDKKSIKKQLKQHKLDHKGKDRILPPLIAFASGKGGVGKSSTAFNVALALAQQGLKIGLLDADIYGPSLTRLAKIEEGHIEFSIDKIKPIEKFGLKLMSIGFFLDEDKAVIWRAPMALGALKKMLYDVDWGDIDFLIADMPPGTGDIALTLAQSVPVSYAVIVSTPQQMALMDVRKAISMYKKLNIPILGILENMSYFIAPDTGMMYHIFGKENVYKESLRQKIDFLGEIPIDSAISEACDYGMPVWLQENMKGYQGVYQKIADKIACLCLK